MEKTYKIHTLELGPMDNFIHIIEDIDSNKAAIFDPAWDARTLLSLIDDNRLSLDKIIISHAHYDHINALEDILSTHNIEVVISEPEYKFYGEQIDNVSLVSNDNLIKLGNTTITAISTPGHSAGGTCYQLSHDVITGDTVFVYGCGHCALPGANPETLFYSLQRLKRVLAPDVTVHCSHNYGITRTSSWQQQLEGNPFLLIDNLETFISYRENIHDQVRTYPFAPISKEELLKSL